MRTCKELKLPDRSIKIKMNDSVEAAEFAALKPFELELSYCGNYLFGLIPEVLSFTGDNETTSPHRGGVYYMNCMQSMYICLKSIKSSVAPLYYLGELEEEPLEVKTVGQKLMATVI